MSSNDNDILNRFSENISETKTADAGRKIRVGIIGTGWIADAHITNYIAQPDVEIVAGADIVPGKAEAFFKKYNLENVKCFGKHTEMLAKQDELKLDAVSICTMHRNHAECTVDTLDAGINVLLEKPMCVTTEEAIEIVRAEKRSGKILTNGFQPRFDPNMKKIKQIVDSGELGKIYYIQSGGGRRRGIPTPYGTSFIEDATAGIGAVGDIGCYSLDMLLNAVGYPKPLTISGYKSSYFGTNPKNYPGHPEYASKFEVDDFAAAFIRLEGDIILDFRVAWAMNIDSPCDAIILGTKGGLRIPATDCWNGSIGGPMTIYHELSGSQVETKIPMIPNKTSNFAMKIRTFIDAVKNGEKPPIPSSQILYNQVIIDGIIRSAKLGREIKVELPEL